MLARLWENCTACSLMASAYLRISSMEAPSAGGWNDMSDEVLLSEAASSNLSSSPLSSEVDAEVVGDAPMREAK